MSDITQRDLIRECDPALAKAYRIAAEVALQDPNFTFAERARRAEYYLAQAAFHETGVRAPAEAR